METPKLKPESLRLLLRNMLLTDDKTDDTAALRNTLRIWLRQRDVYDLATALRGPDHYHAKHLKAATTAVLRSALGIKRAGLDTLSNGLVYGCLTNAPAYVSINGLYCELLTYQPTHYLHHVLLATRPAIVESYCDPEFKPVLDLLHEYVTELAPLPDSLWTNYAILYNLTEWYMTRLREWVEHYAQVHDWPIYHYVGPVTVTVSE